MAHTIREALAAFRRAPLLTGLSAAMIGLSLFVLGLFGVAAHNIRLVLDQVEARVEVVAYLHDETTIEQVEALQTEIRRIDQVRDVIYVSRSQALEQARQQLTDFEAIFTELETNPFPASLEVALEPRQKDADAVRQVAGRIADFPFVEDVRYGRDWLDKVYLLRRVAAAAAMVVGGAFAAVAALIIGAAIRLAIFARRDEIAIMRLVGATDWFIRRPFLLEGLLTGILGSLLALPATYVVFRLLSDSVVALEWMPAGWVAAGLLVGSLFGAVASSWAVRRHLQEL
ncbi:MAG: FtsX-like permease family protein [Gemmatimonadetes bacterium]|nr:ABC transporter permease [Gemmatimonadota bacterium]NIQ54412.1 ABC transporter permease [Gemmatimonadota bacterium]NIU74622.1 FtsX-like permease family protein [Gammaproteobacteria bacterium]NIX44553.1 FtsX-like permease family protein [Gemmatimonadota bacterium]NIY08766.1 FtsX-like permease family protein [Gemmatimonadota bacterium]